MDGKRIRIGIAIPAIGSVPVLFFQNFIRIMLTNMGKYTLDVSVNTSIPVDRARNEGVKDLLKNDIDYIFFWDSDNIIPSNVFDRLIHLMKENDADLVSGIYFEKNKPFYPVLRKYHSGGFWKIENPPLGKVIEIGACGMGCALVKAEVFRKLEDPWFKFNYEKWGYKDIQLSEDLYFCRSMLKAKMKLVCDTGMISAHVGGAVDAYEYMSMAEIREENMIDREELVADMSEHLGMGEDEFNLKTMMGSKWMREEWNKVKPVGWKQIKAFYKQTKNYLIDQYEWHFTKRRKFDLELVTGIKEKLKPMNILDYGCGIGQNALMLAREGFDVTLADLDSYTLDFAIKRFKKHSVPHKVWKVDTESKPPDKKYDLILLFDVLEHIPKGELRKIVNKLIKLKHKDTQVMMTSNFGKSETYPMHNDGDPEYQQLINKLLNIPK